jgi:hypothetical protein
MPLLRNTMMPLLSALACVCRGFPVVSATRLWLPAPERDTQWISRLEELKVASLLVMEPCGLPMWSGGVSVQKLSLN